MSSPDERPDPLQIKSQNHNTETLSSVVAVKGKFWSILQVGLSNVISDSSRAYRGPNAQDYNYEKTMIGLTLTPIKYGVATMTVCFISFRLAANPQFQKFRAQILGTIFRKSQTPPPNEVPANEWMSYTERMVKKREAALKDALAVPLDILLSAMLGFSVAAFNTDSNLLRSVLVLSPHLPGRSLIAEHICPDMTKLCEQVDPSVWKTQGDVTIDTLHAFVVSCMKRDQREREIRLQNNLPDGHPVAIPPPDEK